MSVAVMCCIALFFSVLLFGNGEINPPNVQPNHYVVATDNSLIKTNFDILRKINEPYWSSLNHDEKLDVLQCVVNTEVTYFGLPEALFLKSSILPPQTLGTYAHQTRTIKISRDHLENSPVRDIMITILHEVYHSYQHYQCEALSEIDVKYKDLRLFATIQKYSQLT